MICLDAARIKSILTFSSLESETTIHSPERFADDYERTGVQNIPFCLWPSSSFSLLENLEICTNPDSDWTIPHLPVLRNLSIDFEKGNGASVIVNLGRLPSISSFELSYYEGLNLTILGHSRTLKKVTVMMSYIDLSFNFWAKPSMKLTFRVPLWHHQVGIPAFSYLALSPCSCMTRSISSLLYFQSTRLPWKNCSS